MNDPVIVHRAPWVVTISGPVLHDGAVAVAGDRIREVGQYGDLRRRFSGAVLKDHESCVLMPPLVNAHTHLELSFLEDLGKGASPDSFTGWIDRLIAVRSERQTPAEEIVESGRVALEIMYRQGISIVADTGNTLSGLQISEGFEGSYLFFHEYLGLSSLQAEVQVELLGREEDSQQCVPHAPYSTSVTLLKALKKRGRRLGHLFSIHTAETDEENRFVRDNEGPMRDFLDRRGAWHHSFTPTGRVGCGSVHYLHQHGLLDETTLCVHCVHVTEREVELLADSGAGICLCPGSNRFLGTGKAPVPLFLKHSLLPALGTDSPASNPALSIWREMRLLAEDHPGVEPESIMTMATLGGATALGLENDFGTLEDGRSDEILCVPVPQPLSSPRQVVECLVNDGEELEPYRL